MYNDRQVYFTRSKPCAVFPRRLQTRASKSESARAVMMALQYAEGYLTAVDTLGNLTKKHMDDLRSLYVVMREKALAGELSPEAMEALGALQETCATAEEETNKLVGFLKSNLNRAIDDMRGTVGA